MGVKSNNEITTTDINKLITNIKTLYSKRTVKVSNRTLSETSGAEYKLIPSQRSQNKEIYQSDLGQLIDACLVINDIPNVIKSSQYKDILYNSTTTDILNTWLSEDKYTASGTSSKHGCRGACVGICKNGCAGQGKGVTGTTDGSTIVGPKSCRDCDSGCQNSCNGKCKGACTNNCTGCGKTCAVGCGKTCNGGCCSECTQGCLGDANTAYGVSCGNGCNFTCYTSDIWNTGEQTRTCNSCWNGCISCSGGCGGTACKGNCAGCSGCANSCNTGCKESCGSECYNTCKTGCQNNCTNGCATNCKNGCYGQEKNGCYGCQGQCASCSTTCSAQSK